MKKTIMLIALLGSLMLACSTTDLLPATPFVAPTIPLPTETLAVASTPTLEPSLTPTPTTEPTETFTSVPTLITTASTTSATTSATPSTPGTTTAQVTFTPQSQLTTPQGPVFTSVNTSGNMITWGDNCPATSVIFTAHVANGYDVTSVLLFTRLQSQTSGVTSRWSNGIAMHTDGVGTFTYSLLARNIPYYQDYQQAWVQYQLVATNSMNLIVERSQPNLNSVTLAHCP